MKLKEAEAYFRKQGFSKGTYYICVDGNRDIYLYTRIAPSNNPILGVWYSDQEDCYVAGLDDLYTGKKHWTKAIRKFEV